jgi:hypothetical protein
MAENVVTRFSSLLEQEKHRSNRQLDQVLGQLWADLGARGVYNGSSNVFLTRRLFETDIETRLASVITSATRVVANAGLREAREQKDELARIAVDWLATHIDACQERLHEHATKLRFRGQANQLDLGRDRVLGALSAELDLLGPAEAQPTAAADFFIDPARLDELRSLSSTTYDVSRLVRLCEELNICFRYRCFHKEVATHLESVSRKVSDGLLHVPVRASESLPTLAQVDVRQQLDTVMAEVVRFHRGA